MKIIGITGGIGAGKTKVLSLIASMDGCRIIMADDVAKSLSLPGQKGYEKLLERYGETILGQNVSDEGKRFIDNSRLAEIIFSDESERENVNSILHPLTKEKIKSEALKAEEDNIKYFFIEGALLIEDNYDSFCDEMWYVYAPKDVRIERLMSNRGYTYDKCMSIMEKQLSDEEFIEHSDFTIDNSSTEEAIKIQILKGLGEKHE